MEQPLLETVVQLTDAQLKNADLRTAELESKVMSNVIRLNGKIEVTPENTVTISSPMDGFVREIKWMPGMSVQKGKTLVRLEEKEYIQMQQEYLTVKNALSFAKLDFERQTELVKSQASSDKAVQAAEEKVKQYQITLKSLAEKLKLIHINTSTLSPENMTSIISISAPVSGTITEVFVNSGMFVHAGDEMIKMVNQNDVKLVLKAFEKDLPYLKTGLKILAYSNAKPGRMVEGTIEYIVQSIGTEGFANVICKMSNKPNDLLHGTYMYAEAEVENQECMALPEEAIVSYEGKDYIFTDNGNKAFQMIEIVPGSKENGYVQITNLQDVKGKNIVTRGAYTLLMKMKNVEE
ncbi:MAG: efflux RND transporter periplasmic adaptor subunit [Saprospiraceae bacterium]